MKRIYMYMALILGVAVCAAPGRLHSENPYAFPEYPQTVVVEYANAEEAAKAELILPRLYQNKEIAWSHRSDDSDQRHVRTQKLLTQYGFTTTCYLNDVPEKYLSALDQLVSMKAGIGNHTKNHLMIAELIPNQIFSEIVIHQASVESAANTASVSFTSPFYNNGSRFADDTRLFMGENMRRAGIFYSADSGLTAQYYALPDDSFFTATHMNDTWKYNLEGYDSAYAKCYEKTKKDPVNPHLSHGTHSWHNDAQIKTLADALKKYANRPEIWYTTGTDYGAYSLASFHAKPRMAQKGKNVEFTLTRFHNADLGSELPLTAKFSGKPLKVVVGGKTILPENGLYEIPGIGHTAKKIELLSASASPKKLPALTLALNYRKDANQLVLTLVNKSGKELRDFRICLKAPLKWEKGLYPFQLKSMAAGEKQVLTADLGKIDPRPVCQSGELQFLAKCDFDLEGDTFRAYTVCRENGEFQKLDCPRDRSLLLGPQLDNALSDAQLAEMSKPGTALKNLDTTISGTWRNGGDLLSREFKMQLNPSDRKNEWLKEKNEIWKNPKIQAVRYLAIDLVAPSAGNYYIIGSRQKVRELWLNGVKTDFDRSNKWKEIDKKFPLNQGPNRLIIVHQMDGHRWQAGQDTYGLLVRPESGSASVSFALPDIAK